MSSFRATPQNAGGPVQLFYQAVDDKPCPIISHGKGIYLWDTAGKKYIDGSSGPIAVNIGHGNQRVIDAAAKQMQEVAYVSRNFFQSQANIDLANLVAEHTGAGLERAFFVSGGSEAIESALKLARQYAVTQGQESRWKVISRDPSYHGATLGAVAITGDFISADLYGPMIQPMPKISTPFSYRVPEGHTVESYALECADALETKIQEEGPETVLAFIFEPVGGLATGALAAPEAYYQRVREICNKYGVLLIHDEVMSGVGRCGHFLASQHWPNSQPDIVVLAKGLASGYTPLGAVIASAEMVDSISASGGFNHGFTYSSNPLSCAVGLAAVQEFLDHDLSQNALAMGARLKTHLQDIQQRRRVLGDVRGLGLLMAIEIVSDAATKSTFPAHTRAIPRLVEIAMQKGLLLYSRRTAEGRFGEWLMVAPPLIINSQQVDEMAAIIDDTLAVFEAEVAGENS